MAKLLGKAPNQVPTNADLGSMAFQDREGVNVNNAIVANLVVTSALTSNAPFAVVNSTANVFYGAANGNVGVGTNTPGYKLTVYGNTAYFGAFNTTGATNVYVDSPTAQSAAIAFRQGGGNSIDIGTRKSNNSVFTIRETASGAERITFIANSTTGVLGINNTAPTDTLSVTGTVAVSNSTTSVLYTAANGNIGINTLTPNEKLTVINGNGYIANEDASVKLTLLNRGNNTTGRFPQLVVQHFSGNTSGGDTGGQPVVELIHLRGNTSVTQAIATGDVLGGFNTWGSNATNTLSGTRIQGLAEANFTTTATAAMQFFTTNAGTQTEVVRMSANGNVGIGNTAPNAKLQVTGTANVSGNVAIGGDFVVGGTTTWANQINWNNGVNITVAGESSFDLATGGQWGIWDGSAATFAIRTNYANNIILAENGKNVGIGNTTPNAKLQVTGTANISGNVALGQDLTVAGNLTISGTTTYINTTALNVGDNIITLNADLGAVAPTENAGLEVNRGTSANVQFIWNEGRGRWGAYPLATYSGYEAAIEAYGNNAYFRATATGNAVSNTYAQLTATDAVATLLLDSANSINPASRTTYLDLKAPDYRGSGIYVTQTTAPLAGANAYWFIGKPYTGGAFQIGYGLSPEYQSNAVFQVSGTNTNIGIGNSFGGASFPMDVLHVRRDSASNTGILIQNRNASGIASLKFVTGAIDVTDNRYAEIVSSGGTSSTLTFRTSNGSTPAEVMYMAANGNVGIGNNAPAHKLTVSGRAYFGGTLDAVDSVSIASGDGTSNAMAQMLTSGNAYGRIELGGTTGAYIDFKSPFSDDYDLRMSHISGVGTITTSTDFYISNTTGALALFASNGNVGIGNNTPIHKLAVGGDVVATGNIILQTNTSWLSVASNTNFTGAKIQAYWQSVANTSYQPALSLVHQQAAGTDHAWTWRTGASSPLLLSYSSQAGWTTFTDLLSISNTGNVGIGNTGSYAKLNITDNTNAYTGTMVLHNANTSGAGAEAKIHFIANGYTTYYGQSPSGFGFLTASTGSSINVYGGTNAGTVLGANGAANVMYLVANGNVGIGNNAPTERFSVVGNVYANNLRRFTLQRTLSTTANDTVEIGNFTSGSAGHNLFIAIHVSDSNFSVAKNYTITSPFNATGGATFRKVLPDRDTGPYSLNDFDLEAYHANDTIALRLRRTGGTNAGTAVILVEDLSVEVGDDTFTPTSATATGVAAVTELFQGNRLVQTGIGSSNAFIVAANLTTNAIISNNSITTFNLPVTFNNAVGIGSTTSASMNFTTSATTANQVLFTSTAASYRTTKYLVSITSGSAYQATEITLMHDGTNVYKTEYGTVYSGAVLATFDADINSGSVRLLTTPVNAVTAYKGSVSLVSV